MPNTYIDTTNWPPMTLIKKMGQLGFFAMSIPEAYGGTGMGYLVMIITTEELSRGSLGAAGSLITRPEIVARALLEGGTEAQRRRWLPGIASGELMVAVSVTEPDTGSDVASITCRATPGAVNGQQGYVTRWRQSLVYVCRPGRPDRIAGPHRP